MTEDDALLLVAVRHAIHDGTALALRERSRLSRAEVASVLKVTPQSVGRWEAGEIAPRSSVALRYGHLLARLGMEVTP